ncbi:hypothetical protein FACS189415_7580 [Bacteroidia bacterium]|nr:hypothetical protein FACS189415_7580 [Bacteroidia bacterium]
MLTIMENKSNKYIWIGFCAFIAIHRLVYQVFAGVLSTDGFSLINIAYILIFIAAIIHELNLNRVLFYAMLAVSLLALCYGYFFAPLVSMDKC